MALLAISSALLDLVCSYKLPRYAAEILTCGFIRSLVVCNLKTYDWSAVQLTAAKLVDAMGGRSFRRI
jgi:hypothetical protein